MGIYIFIVTIEIINRVPDVRSVTWESMSNRHNYYLKMTAKCARKPVAKVAEKYSTGKLTVTASMQQMQKHVTTESREIKMCVE